MFKLAVSVTAFLSQASADSVASCATDFDCELSGRCIEGICHCDLPWTGSHCSKLYELPVDAQTLGAAYGLHQQGSAWGGTVTRDDAGIYHLFASEMANGCHLDKWDYVSQVVRAEASRIEGPYERKEVVWPVFHHNPRFAKNPDGDLLLFNIGVTDPSGGQNCSQASKHPNVQSRETPGAGVINVLNSRSPNGPWQEHTDILRNCANEDGFSYTNPGAYIFPNGTVLLAYRVARYPETTYISHIGIATAPHYTGPYTCRLVGIEQMEDPWIYRTAQGYFIMLLHADLYRPGPVGQKAFSLDGLTWTLSSDFPYNTSLRLTDGSVFELARRERPELLFSEDGVATHIINGACLKNGCATENASYTLVTPLQTPSISLML